MVWPFYWRNGDTRSNYLGRLYCDMFYICLDMFFLYLFYNVCQNKLYTCVRPYNLPQNHLSYSENFLFMLDRLAEPSFKPHPILSRALDVLFILHADHELNCSTAAMKHIGSSLVDPYSAVAGAAAGIITLRGWPVYSRSCLVKHVQSFSSLALYGPLHGGANEVWTKYFIFQDSYIPFLISLSLYLLI